MSQRKGGGSAASRLYGELDLILCRPTPTVATRSWVERAQRRQTFKPSAHQELELAWVTGGAVLYAVGGREFTVTPGEAILLPAGHEHQTTFTPGCRASSIHLASDLVEGVAEFMGPAFRRRQLEAGLLPEPERLLRLAVLLQQESAEAGPGSALAADGLAEALTVQVLRGAPHHSSSLRGHDPRIRRALQLIEQSDGAELEVADLARAAGMSRYHFSRVFREMTGNSPYQHLLNVRLAQAAELLRGGHVSVTEAALSAGFNDFGRFATYFERRFGCLPSQFAAARSAHRMTRIA